MKKLFALLLPLLAAVGCLQEKNWEGYSAT